MITALLLTSGLLHALMWALLPMWARGQRLGRMQVDDTVDIVIPARDEADNIGPAVQAALACGDHVRVFVVDDHSSDDTARLAEQAGGRDPRLQVLAAPPLPAGWAGKPWACQVGGQAGEAPLLLFMDADVRLAPATPSRLAARLRDRGASLVSAFGSWQLVSWWERALIPPIGWAVRAWADPARVSGGGLAFANGQCLMVRRAAWEELGGHEVVADDVLDDVGLAAALVGAGHSLELVWAPEAFTVRPYDSLGAILQGYGKNLLRAMGGRRWMVLFIATAVLVVGLGPWIALAQAAAAGDLATVFLASTVCVLMVGHRSAIERKDGRSGAMALAHPVVTGVLLWLLVRAAVQRVVVWRGRAYREGRASGTMGGKA